MIPQDDPFASVRIRKSESIPSKESNVSEEQSEDPFSQVRIKKVEGTPWLYEGGRHAARVASRIAETIGGIPGDIQNLIQSGVFAGLEKLTGKEISEEERKKAREFSEVSPTSSELKTFSEETTKGFTSPQNESEKIGDEYVQTLSSLLGPMKFRKALGIAAGSQAAKEGLKILGTSEGTQEAGKLGTLFLLSLYNPGAAMKFASSQYNKANLLSKGASVNASKLQNDLTQLSKNLELGVSTPGKNVVMKPAEELLKKIKNGKIPVEELTSAKRDLSSLMGDPVVLKREKKLLKTLGKTIDDAIKPFEKINPEFKKAYRPANEIYGAIQEGDKITKYIRKNIGAKSVIGSLLAETALGHPEAIIPTLGSAVALYNTAKGVDFFTRLAKSPELRKFYSKALISAAKEDVGALKFYSNKIDELVEKD